MPIICDDFTDDTFLGETWQATATNLGTGNLGNTLYGASAQSQYDVAAYLATELLAPGLSATTQADLQYAIWYLFDPSQVTTYLDSFGSTYAGLLSAAAADVSAAQAAESKASTALTAAQLAEFTIYTPVAGTAMCGSGPCPTSPPQEFLVYTDPPLAAPEPSTLALLGAGMCLLAVLVRRRNKAAGVVSVA